MKKFLLVLTLLFVTASYAQTYYKGKLVFADGKTQEGFIKPPSGYRTASILFKATEDASKVVFKSDELKSVIIYGSNDNYQFDRGSTLDYSFFKLRQSKPQWMILIVQGHANLYTVGEKIRFKNGHLSIKNSGSIPYYAKREGEEAASGVGFYMPGIAGLEENFRTLSAKYFSDYPALVKRIENKEFSLKEVELVVKEYNKWKASTLAKKGTSKSK